MFEFPLDSRVYDDEVADTQFLIGSDLMAAPIVEQNKTGREVYFPETNWISYQTKQRFTPGTHSISDIKLTDEIPLFIREGAIVSVQNVQKIVNTKQLDNSYMLSMALAYDGSRSNSTHTVYRATGHLLAI